MLKYIDTFEVCRVYIFPSAFLLKRNIQRTDHDDVISAKKTHSNLRFMHRNSPIAHVMWSYMRETSKCTLSACACEVDKSEL